MADDRSDGHVPDLSDELDDDRLLGAAPDPTAHRAWSPTTARVVLALCIARYVVPILALGYAARVLGSFGSGELDGGQVVLLTLLRPAKETLLFAGGVLRVTGEPSPLLLFLAYTPLMIVAVWVFFLLGRIHGPGLTSPDEETWLTRMVPPRYVRATQLLLVDRGPAIAILARIVAAPPTILAAAAGTAPVNALRYLVADAVGAVISFGIMLGLGVALGEAYERAGTPVTVATFVVLLVAISLAQNWFQREVARIDAAGEGPVAPEAG
ncbi:MAG: DedA family protein [Actinomycetes bacterium]